MINALISNDGSVTSASLQHPVSPDFDLQAQVVALTQVFNVIAHTRMLGLPLLHPDLLVEAVGFEAYTDTDGTQAALGILITPWFMNLIWLPLQGQMTTPLGQTCERRFAGDCFEFIGAYEPTFGNYEMCSLFSPMFEFADQASAHATACEVLILLRKVSITPVAASVSGAAPLPGRRAFLLGRVRSHAGEYR
ncbi:MAG: [NiFe]-hydrogenase assembly chaperone HybE [Burkholderiaceae bacterium]|nr:[NiFe]-hydrogenase assembly chaperone HybE [Burkholderiaceae bacterium]